MAVVFIKKPFISVSPLYLRILRHSPLADFATGLCNSSTLSARYFCWSSFFFLFIFNTLDLYLWQTFLAWFSSICWKKEDSTYHHSHKNNIVFYARVIEKIYRSISGWETSKESKCLRQNTRKIMQTFNIHCMCRQSSFLNLQSLHDTVCKERVNDLGLKKM